MKASELVNYLRQKFEPNQEVRGEVRAVTYETSWHEKMSRFHEVPISWYLVNEDTDEILAWVNKRSEAGITFKYKERYFVSLEGAKRAAEEEVVK